MQTQIQKQIQTINANTKTNTLDQQRGGDERGEAGLARSFACEKYKHKYKYKCKHKYKNT